MRFALFVAITLPALALLFRFAIHRAYRVPRTGGQCSPGDLGLTFRSVSIPTANGKSLFGWFVPATTRGPAPVVAILHGWGGNAESMLPFAPMLHHAGFGCLLLDARNHGRSDADSVSSLPRFAEDLESGHLWLAEQPEVDERRRALLGYSVGAAAALLVASRRADVAAVVSIASFAHPAELLRRQMQTHRIPYYPIGWLVLRYIEHAIRSSFEAIAPSNSIRAVRCPVLLVHGEADTRVPITDAEIIYANRSHLVVKLLRLPETEHDSADSIERHGRAIMHFLRHAIGGI